MEWFEDSELDAHLNEHIGLKANADLDDELTKRSPGRRGEFLGGAGAFLGFVTAAWELLLFGGVLYRCTDPPYCYVVPLSTELLLLLSLCSTILALIGAMVVGRHWRAGSLTLLIGGVLPLISWTGLVFISNTDYGTPISFFSFLSFVAFLLMLVWWAPLLIIAGALALSDSPKRRANRGSREGLLKKTI